MKKKQMKTVHINDKMLREAVRTALTKLNEGMTADNEAYDKWEYLREMIGADKMLDCIFDYLDVSMLERIIEWFDEDGYFEGSEWDRFNDED